MVIIIKEMNGNKIHFASIKHKKKKITVQEIKRN